MNNQYLPNTPEQRRQMLEAIGVGSVEELFSYIPEKLRLNRPLNLPHPMAEARLMAHMEELAGRNEVGAVSFLGGGIYDHFSPAAIDHILTRSEFYTAYTPYQLKSVRAPAGNFRLPDHDLQLTGADVANASLRRNSPGRSSHHRPQHYAQQQNIAGGYHASLVPQGPGHLYGGPGRPGGGNPRR